MPARWVKLFIYIVFAATLFPASGLTAYYFGKRLLDENGKLNLPSGPCRNSNLTTGMPVGNYETHIAQLDLINVNVCFLGFEDIKDNLFPDNSLRLKIGLYDDKGKLHIYPARIGGVDNSGRVIKPGVCLPKDSETVECRAVDFSEIKGIMRENTVWETQIVYADNFSWPASSQTKQNSETILLLKEAIGRGRDFPQVPKDSNFVLQIWSLFKLE